MISERQYANAGIHSFWPVAVDLHVCQGAISRLFESRAYKAIHLSRAALRMNTEKAMAYATAAVISDTPVFVCNVRNPQTESRQRIARVMPLDSGPRKLVVATMQFSLDNAHASAKPAINGEFTELLERSSAS